MRYASIGSVSSGTMRTEDLIPAFAWELNYYLKRQPKSFKRAEYRKLIREAEKIEKEETFDTEEAGYTLEELFEALETFAPPYCYFGAHEGDGSDYGFWPSIEGFDGLKVEGLEDVPQGYSGELLIINERGNLTFGTITKRGKFSELWGAV
jgi:hypothetical protein